MDLKRCCAPDLARDGGEGATAFDRGASKRIHPIVVRLNGAMRRRVFGMGSATHV